MKPRSEAGTRSIISLVWLIAYSTAGRWNGFFFHLRPERIGKYARRLWWRMAHIRRKKWSFWLLSAQFIADFFAHRRARGRLINSPAEAISADSKLKLRAYVRGLIRLIWLWNRDLSGGDSITHAFVWAHVTCNKLARSWLITCYILSQHALVYWTIKSVFDK